MSKVRVTSGSIIMIERNKESCFWFELGNVQTNQDLTYQDSTVCNITSTWLSSAAERSSNWLQDNAEPVCNVITLEECDVRTPILWLKKVNLFVAILQLISERLSRTAYSGEDSATWWRIHVGTSPKSSHLRPDNWRNTSIVDHESTRFLLWTSPLKSCVNK